VTVGITGVENAKKLYGAARDLQLYLAERECARARKIVAAIAAVAPEVPIGVGSHQLFVNQAKLGWDIGSWARCGSMHTTSIHLSWHFESVAGEVDLPVYLQARATRDYFKAGFTSAFETTGGAVQFSGGYGNHMDAGLMRRLCLNYLAAGNQTLAFWSWNARPGGWEQGEYGMVGLGGSIMPWAKEVGHISQAMQKYRAELWEDPGHRSIGVVESWDTDGVLIREPHRHGSHAGIPGNIHGGSPSLHRQALIGAGRALTMAQVDWEYVTTQEILDDLAGCYDTLLLPWHRAVQPALLEKLLEFVQSGGRLIVDAQFAFCDQGGRVVQRSDATVYGQLFGAWPEIVHDGRTGGPMWQGAQIDGFWTDLTVTTAEVLAMFDDGRPAMTRLRHGDTEHGGEAILLAVDPAQAAVSPKAEWAMQLLADVCRNEIPTLQSSVPQTIRRETSHAHHYFLINPGPATTAWVHSTTRYETIEDVLDETVVPMTASGFQVRVPADSACWVRAAVS
jgi:hypothetical protein